MPNFWNGNLNSFFAKKAKKTMDLIGVWILILKTSSMPIVE